MRKLQKQLLIQKKTNEELAAKLSSAGDSFKTMMELESKLSDAETQLMSLRGIEIDLRKEIAVLKAETLALKAEKHLRSFRLRPMVIDYAEAMTHFLDHVRDEPHSYPCVIPNWDNSPRLGPRAVILQGSTPDLFREHLHQTLDRVAPRHFEDSIVFVKSWNEWAEGNYLEPDTQYGHRYLDVLREEVLRPRGRALCAKRV